ncbi:DUF2075 domain-containing protein [Panacibacter sp. DH6]|uniref:DUF2075 domain-containing protein n=1 Tax=Panacibacter microcysteis TaxID=2793269 RepID=A0A931GV41_9BACT|nr:DNA/RNA helicase domain-containing protein [Panacibacter microcysteis]MBG9376015.1 DUF2075 domain-containing protein [Panacibacter microcysteis]
MRQAYFHSTIDSFLKADIDAIVGKLNIEATTFTSQWTMTTTSWKNSLFLLTQSFSEIVKIDKSIEDWHILLEYEIPRLSKRIDVIVIAEDLIFVIEFKYDRKKFDQQDIRQAEDYALDLRDFHLKSRGRTIFPILFAPLAENLFQQTHAVNESGVCSCLKANAKNFASIIYNTYLNYHNNSNNKINPYEWEQSEYEPTPTIVQAAKALFAGQGVEDISRFGATNLSKTKEYLIKTIKESKNRNKKVICFVTGVPGAGKTLVGLDLVHEKEEFGEDDLNMAYFSGNGPLINVLREALCRDHFEKQKFLFESKKLKVRPKKKDSEREIQSKIQNLHVFIKDGLRKTTPPIEKIVVFDEAQRCWNAKHFSNKAKQNQNREKNPLLVEEKSEAELLFEFMSRHKEWAVIIALVGGGQEINTGEGGISEWGQAIQNKYWQWEVHISPELLQGGTSMAEKKLFPSIPINVKYKTSDHLHLTVSQRSFKANNLNKWVNAVIDNNQEEALRLSDSIKLYYPLFVTRNIETAKDWLRQKISGSRRIGLIASSGGLRLKPYGINVREEIDETLWFLNPENDVRSSYYLEMVATEYKMQGLELDWVGICWDADLRRDYNSWDFKSFSGTNWKKVKSIEEQQFLVNTYRVLLTRAREGIIIFVPRGDIKDVTRLPEFYANIFNYLQSCGMVEI